MSVSSEFRNLLTEFRDAQVQFEAHDFRLMAYKAGFLEGDLKHNPVGRIGLRFETSGKLGELFFEESVKPGSDGTSWDVGYFFAFEPNEPVPSVCEQTFIDLSVRAGVHLPSRLRQKLLQFDPRGPSCVWWFAFLATYSKEWSLVDPVWSGDEFPIFYEWKHPFLASVNAIEMSGLLEPERSDSTTLNDPVTLSDISLINRKPAPATMHNKIRSLKDTPNAFPKPAIDSTGKAQVWSYAIILPCLKREWPALNWPETYGEATEIIRIAKSAL